MSINAGETDNNIVFIYSDVQAPVYSGEEGEDNHGLEPVQVIPEESLPEGINPEDLVCPGVILYVRKARLQTRPIELGA